MNRDTAPFIKQTWNPWRGRAISLLAFVVLVTLVALRPLIGESYDTAQNSISAGLTELAPPIPAQTVVLDLLTLSASALILSRSWRAREYRSTGLEWGLLLILIAGVVSCAAAGQKRVAINAALDGLCMPVLAIALTQVMTRTWHRRLLLAVIVASAAANAVECLDEAYFSLPETVREYEQHREAFWGERGIPLDSDMVRMFEARLRAGESHGFLVHSNVTGGYLVMILLTAIGVVVAVFGGTKGSANRAENHAPGGGVESAVAGLWILGAVLALLMIWAIALTGSLGAIVGGAGGLGAWVLAWLARRWIAAHPRAAVGIGCGVVVVAGAAVVGHGLFHGTLPGASLNFRWRYWRASAPLIRDHVWTGVGRENFGRSYLQYKSILSPEEVSSPHNLFVQAAAEEGVIGLVGLCAMIVGAMLALARAHAERERHVALVAGASDSIDGAKPPAPGRGLRIDAARGKEQDAFRPRPLTGRPPSEASLPSNRREMGRRDEYSVRLAAALILVVVFAARCPLLGSDNGSYILWVTVVTGAVWLAALTLLLILTQLVSDWRWIAAGGAAGLAAFLIQDTINFALFVPASATTCFAIYALVMSSFRSRSSGAGSSGGSPGEEALHGGALSLVDRAESAAGDGKLIGVVVGVVALLLIATVWQAWFVVRSNRMLSEARRLMQSMQQVVSVDGVAKLFEAPARIDALDPTPWVEAGDWQLRASSAAAADWPDRLSAAIHAYQEALKRDPKSTDVRRRLARTYMEAARVAAGGRALSLGSAGECAAKGVAAAHEITQLYPEDPSAWRLLGECLSQSAASSGDGEGDRRSAAAALNRALVLDASRPEWEVIRRFSPDTRRQIESQIKELDTGG